MTSQLDLDQGGTQRQLTRRFLGPSVGWFDVPIDSILPITAAGTYNVLVGTTLIEVNVAGAVIINLFSVIAPTVPAGVLPGRFVNAPVTIIDTGGFALANPITINPAGGENIVGLSSIQITSNYGGWTLKPVPPQSGWDIISP